MTELLKKAFEAMSALPDAVQDQLAAHLLEELADEAKWNDAFAASAGALEALAKEAQEEYRAGRTVEMGFDEL